jgi:outer membrane protein, multidrug efflux system
MNSALTAAALAATLPLSSLLLAESSPPTARWKTAPSSGTTQRSDWWQLFNDAQLAALIEEATSRNPGLMAQLARIEKARAAVTIARSAWFPRLDSRGAASRDHYSNTTVFAPPDSNTFNVGVDLSYELDVWGRVRHQVRAARAQASSSEADAQAIRLMLGSEVARVYFTLRSIDEEKRVLQDTLKLRKEALEFATARVEAGAANELDRVRAEAEQAGTEAEIAALAGPRAELENVLALVLGRIASDFRVTERQLPSTVPSIPKVLPGELVQRRPDVAAAQRLVDAAQASIGVAKADFFPRISLGAGAGLASNEASDVVDRESEEWTIGIRFSWPLFVAGARKAAVTSANATLTEVRSQYEERVLTAFQEVETQLASLKAQQNQERSQQRLQTAAASASTLARQRYKEGVTTYLEVIEAERTELTARRSLVQLRGQQLVTTVQLIKALGGGWTSGTASPSTAIPPASSK